MLCLMIIALTAWVRFGRGAGRGRQAGGFGQAVDPAVPVEKPHAQYQPTGGPAALGHREDSQQFLRDEQTRDQNRDQNGFQDQPIASYQRRSQEVVNPGGWRDSKVSCAVVFFGGS
jgi:hypothetical protein